MILVKAYFNDKETGETDRRYISIDDANKRPEQVKELVTKAIEYTEQATDTVCTNVLFAYVCTYVFHSLPFIPFTDKNLNAVLK